MLTQEQLNTIIDLLGDVSVARLSLRIHAEGGQLQTKFDNALTRYNNALATRYQDKSVPAVYDFNYIPLNTAYRFTPWESKGTEIIYISPIVNQLNQDFILCDNTDKASFSPLPYTGRYKTTDPTQINCTALSKAVYVQGFSPVIIPSFLMDVLSNFATLMVSATVLGAGAALGGILGVCMAVTGTSLCMGYLGTQIGFFSGPREKSSLLLEHTANEYETDSINTQADLTSVIVN